LAQSPPLAGGNDNFDKGKIGMGVEFLYSIDNPTISDTVFHPQGQQVEVQRIESPRQRGRLQRTPEF